MAFWSNSPLEDREYPDPADLVEHPADRIILPCPSCGSPVYEEARECPHCQARLPDGLRPWRVGVRWYYRVGRYLAKLLALNWLAWIALGILTLLVMLLARLRE